MSLDKEKQQQFFKNFREIQLKGSENLTQTDAIIESRKKKQSDLNNLEEATIKFFNNNQNEKMV